MSTRSQEGKQNKSVGNSNGWDSAIADAKKKIKSLEFSIQVFEQGKREGRPWPEKEKAGTAKAAVPA